MDRQIEYFVKNYPQIFGLTTYFITADEHEGWYAREVSTDVGLRMQDDCLRAGRTDLKYLGHVEHDIQLGGSGGPKIRLHHPGLGTAYALSYHMQKIIESYTGGEKPAILLMGHDHKIFNMYYRNVHGFAVGCFQDQTTWMRNRHLAAMVGGWILTAHLDQATGAVSRMETRYETYYDKAYYQIPWEHKRGKAVKAVVKPYFGDV